MREESESAVTVMTAKEIIAVENVQWRLLKRSLLLKVFVGDRL